jgi:hypothetical protein
VTFSALKYSCSLLSYKPKVFIKANSHAKKELKQDIFLDKDVLEVSDRLADIFPYPDEPQEKAMHIVV